MLETHMVLGHCAIKDQMASAPELGEDPGVERLDKIEHLSSEIYLVTGYW